MSFERVIGSVNSRYVKSPSTTELEADEPLDSVVYSAVGEPRALIRPPNVVPSTMVCSPQIADTPLRQTTNERVLSSQRLELSSRRKASARPSAVSGAISSR